MINLIPQAFSIYLTDLFCLYWFELVSTHVAYEKEMFIKSCNLISTASKVFLHFTSVVVEEILGYIFSGIHY